MNPSTPKMVCNISHATATNRQLETALHRAERDEKKKNHPRLAFCFVLKSSCKRDILSPKLNP